MRISIINDSPRNKQRILQGYLWILCGFLLFWWPLSHWFYPDWYHHLLGFSSYDFSMVKIIGTTGMVPTMCLLSAAKNPARNKDILVVLIVFSFLMAATYIYLILTQSFPIGEYLNVALSLINGIILLILFPRSGE